MTRGFDIPKASPESVARAIFDAVDNGEEEIFPDPASAPMEEVYDFLDVLPITRCSPTT
jgi:hypothetical protein